MNQPPGYPPGPPFGSSPAQPGQGPQQAYPQQQPQGFAPQPGFAPQQQSQGYGPPQQGFAQPQQGFGQPGQQPYPQQGYGPPQQGYGYGQQAGFPAQQQYTSSPVVADQGAAGWKWHYSRFCGVMYGPIPVGVIVVALGYIIYLATAR